MRKLIWIPIALLVTAFLIYRGIRRQIDRAKNERISYIKTLGFDFSGRIDSVFGRRHVLISVTRGNLDRNRERALGNSLKINGELDLFHYREDGRFIMFLDSAYRYIGGDSICINSEENKVSVYRKGTRLSSAPLLKSLNGRPF